MPIRYTKDILAALKDAGYTTYRLRNEKIIGEQAIQKVRNGELASWAVLSKVCELLHCQPGDLLEYAEEEKA